MGDDDASAASNGHALYARFLRGLALAPGQEAIRVGTESVTYEAVHHRALIWAGALLAAPGRPPRAVGVLAEKGVPAYVGILAALYAGAAVVPLRPDFPAARSRQMLDAAGVSSLIVDDRARLMLPGLLGTGAHPLVFAPGCEPGRTGVLPVEPLDNAKPLDQPRPVEPSDTAYVLFTSGSTGHPKGVPITHGNTSHYFRLLDARYDFTPEDVFTQTFDLNFDCAMFDLFCAWGAGAKLVAVPAQAYRELPSFIERHGVTVWFSTPSSISLARRMGGLGANGMPSLRWSFFAGEELRCEDARDWQQAAPVSCVENLYGPTELTITCTAHRWSEDLSPRLAVNGVVPIGRLHDGHEFLLLGPDGEQAPSEGELYVSGPQLTPGYLAPEDNDGRFLERGSCTWYRTGDRVRTTESGELLYLGRIDTQVQIQGWRVELAEIDHAFHDLKGVSRAVTVSASTDGRVQLVVFYAGTPTPPVEIARHLRQVLPHGLVPQHYQHIEDMPLNANRKIDRSALRQRAAELLQGKLR